MIVTIDGPSGAGKSTASRRLAAELGFRFLDTGAMYRALAWKTLAERIDPDDVGAVIRLAERVELRVDLDLVEVDAVDVTREIRTSEISNVSSKIAAIPEIRELMVAQQRRIARMGNCVCEGRDQGTVVFPEAFCKFFLTASAECRARRRHEQLDGSVTIEELVEQQRKRDDRDSSRSVSPLKPAEDAIILDTTTMSLDEVVENMRSIVKSRLAKLSGDIESIEANGV